MDHPVDQFIALLLHEAIQLAFENFINGAEPAFDDHKTRLVAFEVQ